MIKKIKNRWENASMNEKLMYGLIVILVIGILTRWNYVWGEIGDAFGGLFGAGEDVVK